MGLICIQAGIVNNHNDDIGVAIGDDEYASACSNAGDNISRGSMLGGEE